MTEMDVMPNAKKNKASIVKQILWLRQSADRKNSKIYS